MRSYTLVRTRRTTASILIRPGGLVEVRAPQHMPKAALDQFVAEKESWIAEKCRLAQEQQARRDAFALAYGGTALLRGREIPIAAGNAWPHFDGTRFCVPPALDAAGIQAACEAIYRQQARTLLPVQAQTFAQVMGVVPVSLKINGAKTRWGSCSAAGNLNFSWRLLMADDAVIDYVVVHELAHLRKMNHSARFWAVVAGVLPDYPARRAQLRALQERLRGETW
ncbi:MAG: M48 family metallopeptidase [Oscillospiraceae bacterium]|jgi:predicted metal-dependent hydrolase|nr:M48 family metallopeptidase [Oscillospiraceae bacterium]